MGANIIDYVASFVILLGLLTFTITATTGTLDNLYIYHSSQQLNSKATNLLNDLAESTGSPSDWAQSVVDPTSLGLGWSIGEGNYISPFVPMRMLSPNNEILYGLNNYGDLSSSSLSSWPNANLYLRTQDSVTYDEASKLLDTNDGYGWRVTYTPAYQIEMTTSTPSVIPWYTGWGYRMALTINHTKIPATMTGYPILISITQPSLGINARHDGADLLFTASDKLTKLPHEIDSFDSGAGKLNAWVNIPSLSKITDTVIYLYYGNPAAENQESPSLVWAGYTSVFHMEDDPDSTHIADSSSSGLIGTKAGDHEPAEISNGIISFSQNFDGSNDFITLSQATLSGGSEIFEMWLKSVKASTSQTILSNGFKNNTIGFIDISRLPQTDSSVGDDLMVDYAGAFGWVQKAATVGIDLTCLTSFKNNLYGGASDGRFFKWDGVSAWTAMPSLPSPEKFSSISVFSSKLYAGTNGGGKLYEWDEGYSAWILKAPTLKIKCLLLYTSDNKIYGGTDDGRLLCWNTATSKWDVVAPALGTENSINCLAVFGGSIYAGTSPGGKLYQWNGVGAWISVASPPVSYPFTDVSSLVNYNGKLYAGTNPGGYLMSWSSGSSWLLEHTTGEGSITSLNAQSATQTFGYASGGSSGGWAPGDNARLSDNQYLSHSPEIIHSPSSYPSTVWSNPANAYSSNGAYARTSTSNAQQGYSGYGTYTAIEPITKVYIGIQGYASNTNQALRLSVYDGTTWRTVTPDFSLSTTNPAQPTWIDVTSLTTWTLTKLNALQTRVQFIKSGGGTRTVYLDWLPLKVSFSPATQVFSSFSVSPSGSSVVKVEVGVEGYLPDATGDEQLSVSVSSDNGVTWSPTQTITLPHPSDTNSVNYLDFTSYRTPWTTTMLDNSHFKIKITDVYVGGVLSVSYIDYIGVRIMSGQALFASTSPHTYTWSLSPSNVWTKVIDTQYSTESSVSSLIMLSGTLYACTTPSGILVKRGTGVDSNKWVLAASPPSAQQITTLLTDGTTIFGGTTPSGLLYKSTGSSWSQVASTQYGGETSILSLAFDSTGTRVEAGTNLNGFLVGVLKTQTGGGWTKNADISLSGETKIPSMTVYNGKLYLGTSPHGLLYEWDGVNAWIQRAAQYSSITSVNSLAVLNGNLLGSTSSGSLLMWTTGSNAWNQVAPQFGSETINAVVSYNNKIYGSTSPGGRLLEWDSINDVWVGKTYILGAETSISSLAVYNGKLYGGTSPSGLLYEWDGATKWARLTNTLNGQVNIPALAVYNNKLYGTTQASGCLFEFSDIGSRIVPNFFTGYENKWMHVTIIIDYTQKKIDFYRNGTLLSTSLTSPVILNPAKTPKYVGAYVVAGTAYNSYCGCIDELRITQLNKDQNWITLSFNNQRSPSSFTTISPEESIFFKVKVKVSSSDGVVSGATCGGTLVYCSPGATAPRYAQLNSDIATTDENGETDVLFRGFTTDNEVYFILMRANHAGVYGVGYCARSPTVTKEPLGVFATDYGNGGLTITHRKDFDSLYPDNLPLGYNATFTMPIGTTSYRSVSLNSAGQVSPGSPGNVQLGTVKESPGVLIVFYKTAANTYGLTYTPWGISALGLEATFGAPIKDATNVITKSRLVNIGSFTYSFKIELWGIGR